MKTNVTFTNRNPETIWNRLAKKLGREPTPQEAAEEVKAILAQRREVAQMRRQT